MSNRDLAPNTAPSKATTTRSLRGPVGVQPAVQAAASAPRLVEELQRGEPGQTALIFISPAGKEETYFRRVFKLLGPGHPATLISPAFTAYSSDLYAAERVCAEIAETIRDAIAPGPFVTVGFCYAGMFAFDAAARLASVGCVGAVLIDSPMPGNPQFPPSRRSAPAYKRIARGLVVGKDRPGRREAAVWLARKLLWYFVFVLRPLFQPLQRWRLTRWPANWARGNSVDFLRLRPLPVPLLSLLAAEPTQPFYFRQACLDWDQLAGAGATVHVLPCHHTELFFRGNLPVLVGALAAWLQQIAPTPVALSGPGHAQPDSQPAPHPDLR